MSDVLGSVGDSDETGRSVGVGDEPFPGPPGQRIEMLTDLTESQLRIAFQAEAKRVCQG
jgi:hypothetical protein